MTQNPKPRTNATHFFVLGQIGENISLRLKIILAVTSITLFLFVWGMIAALRMSDPWAFPSPFQVFLAFFRLLLRGDLGANLSATVIRSGIGFFLATIVSIPLVILMGTFARIRALLLPLLSLLRYGSIFVLFPPLMLYLGTGEAPKITLIFIGVILFNVLMLMDKDEFLPRDLIDSSLILGGRRTAILTQVIFPYILPRILRVCRINFAVAWQLAILSEWFLPSTEGMGRSIGTSARYLRADEMFASSILLSVVGFGIDRLLQYLINTFCNRSSPQTTPVN